MALSRLPAKCDRTLEFAEAGRQLDGKMHSPYHAGGRLSAAPPATQQAALRRPAGPLATQRAAWAAGGRSVSRWGPSGGRRAI